MRAVWKIWKLLVTVVGVSVILIYLLVQVAIPDPVSREHTLHALYALTWNDTALQRDLLKARVGLLPNYDQLVHTIDNLYNAVNALRNVRVMVDDLARTEFGRHLEDLTTAIAEQEVLVEDFKSDNALLQNSLTYFTHACHEFVVSVGNEAQATTMEVEFLMSSMLRLMHDPDKSTTKDLIASLDRLAHLPAVQPPPRRKHPCTCYPWPSHCCHAP